MEELQVTEAPPGDRPSGVLGPALVAAGRERGFVTAEQVAEALEEVDLSAEAVRELHAHLLDAGVEVLAEAPSPNGDGPTNGAVAAPVPDLAVEPGVDSLRLYLHAIGRVELLT